MALTARPDHGSEGSARPQQTSRSARFLLNVLWNWLGVGVGLISGLLLSPYMIRKLGPDGYGVWALSFSMVEYYWLLDLGFRAATIKYVAHYQATGEPHCIREIINTALLYSACAAALILAVVASAAPYFDRLFQISPLYRQTFPLLVILITLSWCLGMVFNLFGACVEAVQRFDLSNRVAIAGTTLRTLGTATLLYLGYNLIAVGIMVICSQMLTYGLNYWVFRRLFPEQAISPRYATRARLKQMSSFGIHTFVANFSNQLLGQAAPLLIGHFRPARFVGYYGLPVRLLQYTVEMVGRIGLVTNSNAAELSARNESASLIQLAIYPNRYCLTMFMPLAIVLWTHGDRLFQLWVGAAFAAQSAPVLPVLLAGSLVAIVGQFSSSMLLQGLARYQRYARGLLAEAIAGIITLVIVIPRYGIVGGAYVITTFMIANRAIYASWLTSQVIGIPFWSYVHQIYTRPFLTAVPVMALSVWLRASVLQGRNWLEMAAVFAAIGISYYALAAVFCTQPEHRALLIGLLARLRRSRRPA